MMFQDLVQLCRCTAPDASLTVIYKKSKCRATRHPGSEAFTPQCQADGLQLPRSKPCP
jgi:hypothetical protein